MATPVPESDGTNATSGTTNAHQADTARIRADALASAQRLVETARRSAEELHEQAVRQSEALLRAARAEVERLKAEATSQEVAKTLQQVTWDAPGRVLEAAIAEADLLRAEARAGVTALLADARRQARREATEVLREARDQVAHEQQRTIADLQAVGEELTQLQQQSSALLERLGRLRARLATLTPEETRGAETRPLLSPTANPDRAPAAVTAPPGMAQPVIPPPPAPSNGLLKGDLDLVLPDHADRMTVEVLIAVLRDQPGITVGPASRRHQSLVIPLVVDRPAPLIPILQELPRVVVASYSPPNGTVGSASGGTIVIELGDRSPRRQG